ncbi:unnamed protein product [Rotaria socialis]|uniref:DUF1868 domain-containing protein n=1 Tax=Rotaria socialis TaxID=392032 RepID=A0A821HMK6_9BILA|nr:unnamed protein product [Rotaria socialis]
MEENDDKPAWKKCDTGFSLSASTPMQGCEIYLPEPLGTTHAIVVVTVTTNSEFRVVFNCEPTPSRSTGKPALCFVVGQDGNSRTTVREGNPGVILAETKEKRALLTSEKEQQTAFWFSFGVSSQIAAFGLGNHPGSDSTLLVVPDWCGCFEKTKCRLFIGVANWTQPLHLFLSQHHTSGLGLNSYPHKFNDDKTIKPFDGVTCICRVNEKSHGAFIHKALFQAQEILKATGPTVGGCFSFLPPDSFHMTLTDLVTSRNRLTVCPKIKGDMRQVGEELRQRSAVLTQAFNCYECWSVMVPGCGEPFKSDAAGVTVKSATSNQSCIALRETHVDGNEGIARAVVDLTECTFGSVQLVLLNIFIWYAWFTILLHATATEESID